MTDNELRLFFESLSDREAAALLTGMHVSPEVSDRIAEKLLQRVRAEEAK